MKKNRCGRTVISWMVVALGGVCWSKPASAIQTYLQEPLEYEEVINGLRGKTGMALEDLLFTMQLRLDATEFTSEEIAQITEELKRIANEDSAVAPGEENAAYPIRIAARALLPRLEGKSRRRGLRMLPEDQRLLRILDDLEKDAPLSREHRSELVAMGSKAVPLLLKRAPHFTKHRLLTLDVLGEIGDPSAIDYLGSVLSDPDHASEVERLQAAHSLGKFEGDKVIRFLVDALKDDTFQTIDRCPEPKSRSNQHRCEARFYHLQQLAAESLARVAGHHWGWLYQEDFKTWSAWLDGGKPSSYQPSDVPRTREELDELIKKLFQRYMSGRPTPQARENSLDDPIAVKTLAGDLHALGKRSVDPIVARYRAVIAAAPAWSERLTPWSVSVLRAMDLPEATAAADTLEQAAAGSSGGDQ